MPEQELEDIRDAIERAEVKKARELLRDALQNPTADAYYLASQVALGQTQRAEFLEKALELDPFHQQAADQMAQPNHKDMR
jgi:hypothetical protein